MQARFLLGPAGSGKTFRCLAEVRAALRAAPDGPPLILLAPKQATFQIERQLLADGEISGFTRLNIFSFDKLARFVLDQLHIAPPKMLSSEGRVMVLRALLLRHEGELQLFGRSARRPGFAAELSALLSELQRHQFTPEKLRTLAGSKKLRPELQNKLRDLALILERYAGWLTEHELQDTDCLLDFATEALRGKTINHQLPAINFSALWLDGFAEMTPQELDFLAVVLPLCERATLAFCLESAAAAETSRLSIWSAISQTFQQCRARLANLPGAQIEIETLERDPQKNRFAGNPTLQTLEQNWARPNSDPSAILDPPSSPLHLAACANPEAEAVFAAREILKFVRTGHRFRDCAVLVRTLDAHHKALARVFRRYEIPFFLDRREAVTHHPLAELTRSALRTVAFDWQPDDWFAALKAGFSTVAETAVDRLENAALEFGWRGKKWREPLADAALEAVRAEVIPPFEIFSKNLGGLRSTPTGGQLAAAIRKLWNDLDVEPTLERWASDEENPSPVTRHSSLHQTVWEQMNAWLDNVALAFPHESLTLRDWLPVLEAGLAGLTVGVIPPALDQVLVGAIDRARNPDLKFTLVLGVNESVFPATPAAPAILTNADRVELENQNAALGANVFDQISRERYLGYIACTRAGEKLAVTFSRQSAEGKTLNPSPFIAQLQRMFPELEVEEFAAGTDWREAQHANELVPLLNALERQPPARHVDSDGLQLAVPEAGVPTLLEIPALKSLAEKLAALCEPDERENLSPGLAEKIYGATLRSSVSRLEEFASCPFKFFIKSGLRAGERKVFELDARERGNFQHDVLKIFHEQLSAEGKRWRDLTPIEARQRIGDIAAAQMEQFRDGLLRDSAESVFAARAMAGALQDFIEVIVTWMREQYEFDPAQVELGFGGKADALPAWEIDLGAGHRLALQGRIDRVDLWREPGGDTALAVVTDYKSGGKKLDSLLVENGVQLQLLAYLGALRNWSAGILPASGGANTNSPAGSRRSSEKIIPAGAFYVSLQGKFDGGDTRDEILGDAGAKKLAYRHNGRFDASVLRLLDRRPGVENGDQFNFRLKQDGTPYKTSKEVLSPAEFEKLIGMVEDQLRALGGRIFSGAAEVDPYRKGKQTPCEFCDYRAACRIDEWTHDWRVLRAEKAEATT